MFPVLAKKAKSQPPPLRQEQGATASHEPHDEAKGGIDDFLAKWTEIQRQSCEAQASLLRNYLESHDAKFQEALAKHALKEGGATKLPALGASLATLERPPTPPLRSPAVASRKTEEEATNFDSKAPLLQATAEETTPYEEPVCDSEEFEEQIELMTKHEDWLSAWRRADGMHTVAKWCTNYLKHPAGWGALLMIHGIPEVTGRLRSKVENYAIYSALFLSVSMGWLSDPPGHISESCESLEGFFFWECEIQKRLFAYCVGVGTGTHMLSILLAMTFINVLNETARDCDVIRMFSRGKGFLATVRVQICFRIGCVADFFAMIIAAKVWLGWEVFVLALIGIFFLLRDFKATSILLWESASIVSYWRSDLGGKPDDDDPYDIDFPLSILQERARYARSFKRNRAAAQGESLAPSAHSPRVLQASPRK